MIITKVIISCKYTLCCHLTHSRSDVIKDRYIRKFQQNPLVNRWREAAIKWRFQQVCVSVLTNYAKAHEKENRQSKDLRKNIFLCLLDSEDIEVAHYHF